MRVELALRILGIAAGLTAPCALADERWFGPAGIDDWAHKRHVSVGFASADMTSPMSTFGHPFLLAHDETPPEPDAVVFEFLGDTESHPTPYAAALLTSIAGVTRLRRFVHKAREYDLEDRDLWIYPVILDRAQRSRLDQALGDRLTAGSRYTFARQNCALAVHEILEAATPEACRTELITYPILRPADVLSHHKKCGRLAAPSYSPATARKAESSPFFAAAHRLSREPSPDERDRLFRRLKERPLEHHLLTQPDAPEDTPASFVLMGRSTVASTRILACPWQRSFFGASHDGLGASYLELGRIDLSVRGGVAQLDEAAILRLDLMRPATETAPQLTRLVEAVLEHGESRHLALRFGAGVTFGSERWVIGGTPFAGLLLRGDLDRPARADLGLRIVTAFAPMGFARLRLAHRSHFLQESRRRDTTLEAVSRVGASLLLGAYARAPERSLSHGQLEAGVLAGYAF